VRPLARQFRAAIDEACEVAGGQAALARACEVSPAAIHKVRRTLLISESLAMRIHRATGGKVPASRLRPDVWARAEHVPI